MGQVMPELLRLLQIPFVPFHPATLDRDVVSLTQMLHATRKPVALVVSKGMLQS